MRRLLLLATTLAALLAPVADALAAGRAGRVTLGSWNLDDQEAVAASGLLSRLQDGHFHGERAVAGGQARAAFAALAERLGQPPATGIPEGRLSVFAFDRALVAQVGLADVAEDVQREARRAGLRPPAQFGDEVVVRLLGLRHDHPYGLDQLELYPWEAITRAEAAYSLARAETLTNGVGVDLVRATLARFVLPRYDSRQLRALRVAVAKVGMPYIWGGETDRRSSSFGGQVHGGYDCSGFAWRVFKLAGLPEGPQIRGRTAAGQAGEVSRSARIRLPDVRPADLVFFGPGRYWQKATEKRIVHMGIALSKDFMVHSSGSYGGVSVAPLFTPARAAEFSWGRRLK